MEEINRGLDLEIELTCSICTEVLYAPQTLLDCLHTFCGSCLKEWFRWQHSSWRNNPDSFPSGTTPFTCPSCRAPVRDTKHNSTVTTLLEMFLTANPEKCRRAEELEELKKIYCRGDDVLPKFATRGREKTRRDRQNEATDRSLVDEVREMSLHEALEESSNVRREAQRRRDENLHASRPTRNRGMNLETRMIDERTQVRRRRRDERHSRQSRESSLPSSEISLRRRRSRSDGERLNLHEHSNRLAVNRTEHQPSLRSWISPNDVESLEMEEEILRQIREERLLDGIDLENIDVSQEDQISEWIAEAFQRRQNELARHGPTHRNPNPQSRQRNRSSPETFQASRENLSRAASATLSRSSRNNIRNLNNAEQTRTQNQSSSSSNSVQTAHTAIESRDDSRQRHRRTINSNQSVTEPLSRTRTPSRSATRSALNLRDRSQSLISPTTWSRVSQSSRSSIDLTTPQPVEPTTPPDLRISRIRPSSASQSTPSSITVDLFPIIERNHDSPSDINTAISSPNSTVTSRVSSSSQKIISDRAHALSNGPTISSCLRNQRNYSEFYTEPLIKCHRCKKDHIEYEWHYNCKICSNGHYNICLSCYRSGQGCMYWLGIGQKAWKRWEILKHSSDINIEKPHTLIPSRYLPPKIVPGGADGRRTMTTDDPRKRLQSGTYCVSCFAWTNECYWRCETCNDGDWGFCNNCVNQGRCCSHPILPLTYCPTESNCLQTSSTDTNAHVNERPSSAIILTGPGVIDMGPFKPLTFNTQCDICHHQIQPSQNRYHCFSCISKAINSSPGNYDVCANCYHKLVQSRRISAENGPNGWRRCLKGHQMVVVGFQEKNGGQYRFLLSDIVGGRSLRKKPCTSPEFIDKELELWSWGDGHHVSGDNCHAKLVTTSVKKSSPTSGYSIPLDKKFPPDGGVGMKALAIWGWYPATSADDELLFPRGAQISECKDVNGDWYYGSYMGKQGLFPSNYVRVVKRESSP